MSWTKRQLVNDAYEVVGLASYTYDLKPEQLQGALRSLDSLMAMWNGRGIRIGYPLPISPEDSDLDQETGIPDYAVMAVVNGLAILIAPKVGKTLSNDTQKMARDSYRELLAHHTQPTNKRLPTTMPAGAGNKPWRYSGDPFIQQPQEEIDAGNDSAIDFE